MADIIIAKFRGVYRSADPDDLTPDFFYTQKNAKIRPGKLVKDYGFGIKCDNKALSLAANYTIYRMAVQTHPNLTKPTGYRYYIIAVHNSTYVVKIYHYDDDNDIWDELSLSEPYYHKKAWNPVIQTPDAIRFLPGNTGKPDGTHTAKGIWYGYIDRDLFWNTVVTIAAFTNYNTMPAHDGYDILATDTLLTEAVAGLGADTYYYKLVPIYDGVQEPLLPNDFVSGDIDADKVFRIQWTMDSSTFCKRITGFKIYRASATDPTYYHVLTVDTRITDGNLLYKSGSIVGYGLYVPDAGWVVEDFSDLALFISGESVKRFITNNSTDIIWAATQLDSYWGDALNVFVQDTAFSPNCGNDCETDNVTDWSLTDLHGLARTTYNPYRGTFCLALTSVDDDGYALFTPGATSGYVLIDASTDYCFSIALKKDAFADDICVDFSFGAGAWNQVIRVTSTSWVETFYEFNSGANTLLRIRIRLGNTTGYEYGAWVDDMYLYKNQGSPLYSGVNTIINDDYNLGIEDNLANYRALVGTSANGNNDENAQRRRITNNVTKAVKVDSDFTGPYRGTTLKAYICAFYLWQKNDTDKIDLWFYDYGLVDGSEHPLAGGKSIDVNGEFVRYFAAVGRLMQLNNILDPDNTAEIQAAGLCYSEHQQLDINPVSNLKLFYDREGSEGTGLAEIFGNPVVLQKRGVHTVYAKSDPADPTNWPIQKSIHNIGNIAKNGYCEANGDLLIVFYDGIYRLSPNNLAETDQTPTQQLRISDPIESVFLALSTSQKEAIQSRYNQEEEEVIFRFTNASTWAYSMKDETWREIDSGENWDFCATGEENQVLIFDNTDKKCYGIDVDEAVAFEIMSNDLAISDSDKGLIRSLTAVYKSAVALTVNIYTDGDDSTVVDTFTLPVSSVVTAIPFGIRVWAQRFKIKIFEDSGSTSAVEFNKLITEVE